MTDDQDITFPAELTDATPEEERRIDALRTVLRDDIAKQVPEDTDPPDIRIYCFRDPWGGVRVSEVSYSYGQSGTSAQASEPETFGFIFAAERYLIDCLQPVEGLHDAEQEARRGLLFWLMPERDVTKLPEWETREENPLADNKEESDADQPDA